jgi:DNA end-binding protein Ku
VFFDRPYYLEPEKKGEKAYAMLREALKKAGKVGIAKVVIKTRQHLASVKPNGKVLVLELMHFDEELIETSSLKVPGDVAIGAKELDMAEELIERMAGKWDAEKYTDDYAHALLELIEKKIEAGGKELPEAPAAKRRPAKVIDLVSVLQESLQQTHKGRKAKAPKHRKVPLKKAA